MRRFHRIAAVALGLTVLSLLAPTGVAANSESHQHQGDGMVRLGSDASYVGDNVYNRSGAGQSRSKRIGKRGGANFYVKVQNDGDASDTFRVRGSSHNRRFRIGYYTLGRNVSAAVKGGSLRLRDLAPGAHRILRVRIQTRSTVPKGAARTAKVTVISTTNGTVDVTKSKLYRPRYTKNQKTVAAQVNATRAARGRAALRMNLKLTQKAQKWSHYLASIGRLAHSNLRSGVPSNWRALAENVGYGGSLGEVHQAFLGSSGHRANILGRYNQIGTGVTYRGGRVYVVHVFMRT
jgi:uncharacterized protein YkwD